MPFKINISSKDGKTYKLELESEELMGKQLKDKVEGKDLNGDLSGYEFEITGTSDKAGFPASNIVEGIGLKRVLLTYGMGMHKRPKKEGKRNRSNPKPKGLRLRKTMRGKVISGDIVQINMKVTKQGSKPLAEIFSDQNKPKEKVKWSPPVTEKPAEAPAQ